MVQILDIKEPEVTQRLLSKDFGPALQGFLQNMQQSNQQAQQQEIAKRLLGQENETLKRFGIDVTGLENPETRKTVIGEMLKRGTSQAKEQAKVEVKQKEEEKKHQEESKEWERVFNELEKGIPYTGAPIPFTKSMFAKFPWSKAAENREIFDVTAFQLERYARAAHTKGTLSAQVYNSLMSKLPSSELSEAKNRGRIKAWKDALLNNKKIPNDLEKLTEGQVNMRAPNGEIVPMSKELIEEAIKRGWKQI